MIRESFQNSIDELQKDSFHVIIFGYFMMRQVMK